MEFLVTDVLSAPEAEEGEGTGVDGAGLREELWIRVLRGCCRELVKMVSGC